MNKILFTLIFSIFISAEAMSQRFSMDHWHEGSVILSGGERIKGILKYDLKNNSIQIQAAGSDDVYALSAQKIVSLEFMDKVSGVYRRFHSLPYSLMNNNYNAPVLFEVVVEGPLTLLTREQIENKTQSYGMYGAFTRPEVVYTYYLIDSNGKIVEYNAKKKHLKPFLQPYEEEVFDYIKDKRLKTDQRTDLAKIIIYYNQLNENRQ